jgi:hypothetical protein
LGAAGFQITAIGAPDTPSFGVVGQDSARLRRFFLAGYPHCATKRAQSAAAAGQFLTFAQLSFFVNPKHTTKSRNK